MHSAWGLCHALVDEETLAHSFNAKAGAGLYFSFGIENFFKKKKITSSTNLQIPNENFGPHVLESLVRT